VEARGVSLGYASSMALGNLGAKLVAALLAAVATSTLPAPATGPGELGRIARGQGLATKKGPDVDATTDPALLATLDQVHTGEHVALDLESPTQVRFDALLTDRATGEHHALDERLLGLLRTLATAHPGSRVELVSGYRSPKLNEMLRKKGHHVASHSQHSLGHACDFRIVPPGSVTGLDPAVLEVEIRKLGWDGGVGIYPTAADWFVHADVGPNRRWVN
jgi:uncharacterized protein YcbK (DUF882 family)